MREMNQRPSLHKSQLSPRITRGSTPFRGRCHRHPVDPVFDFAGGYSLSFGMDALRASHQCLPRGVVFDGEVYGASGERIRRVRSTSDVAQEHAGRKCRQEGLQSPIGVTICARCSDGIHHSGVVGVHNHACRGGGSNSFADGAANAQRFGADGTTEVPIVVVCFAPFAGVDTYASSRSQRCAQQPTFRPTRLRRGGPSVFGMSLPAQEGPAAR
jgi:hypothetical protein